MYYNYHASLSRHVTSANTQHTEANKFIMNGQGGLADTVFENVKSETFIYSKSLVIMKFPISSVFLPNKSLVSILRTLVEVTGVVVRTTSCAVTQPQSYHSSIFETAIYIQLLYF